MFCGNCYYYICSNKSNNGETVVLEDNTKYDDQIDLFSTLWDGKWFITAFIVMTTLLGIIFINIKEPVYESKLAYSINAKPPFYTDEKVFTDFKKYFYSKKIFEEWKKSIGTTSLVFDSFSETQEFEGILISKKEDDRLANLISGKKGISFVVIKSNQLSILNDFFKYNNFINNILTDEYNIRAKDELRIIESRLKDVYSANVGIAQRVLDIDRFVVTIEKGSHVFKLLHPTIPKKVKPITSLIILMSVLIGGMLGAIFFHIRKSMIKRKQHQL